MKLVRVAAEEGDLLFGRENQSHVRIFLVAVEPVFAALIQRYDVGAEARAFLAFPFHFGDSGAAPGALFFRCFRTLKRCLYPLGHVLSRYQNVDFEVRRLHLFFRRIGVETVAQVVVLSARVLLKLPARHMMIGQQQAMRADKRTGSTVVEADARQANMVQPLPGGGEMILLLKLRGRRVIKRPHALVGKR